MPLQPSPSPMCLPSSLQNLCCRAPPPILMAIIPAIGAPRREDQHPAEFPRLAMASRRACRSSHQATSVGRWVGASVVGMEAGRRAGRGEEATPTSTTGSVTISGYTRRCTCTSPSPGRPRLHGYREQPAEKAAAGVRGPCRQAKKQQRVLTRTKNGISRVSDQREILSSCRSPWCLIISKLRWWFRTDVSIRGFFVRTPSNFILLIITIMFSKELLQDM